MSDSRKLNVIGLTQGANVDIFLLYIQQIRNMGQRVDKVGVVASFASHFNSSQNVKNLGQDVVVIKEWEIVKRAIERVSAVDFSILQKKEEKLAPAAVWKSIIGDRRLIYGRRAKYTQDYRVEFSDVQLWSMAHHFIEAFERMLNEVKPDVILGFTPVTFGELLALEIAESKGVPTLQLHSSRIKNYFALHDSISGTSEHFRSLVNKNTFKKKTLEIAESVIEEVFKKGLVYEGANESLSLGRKFQVFNVIKSAPKAIVKEGLKAINRESRTDHHDPGHVIPWFYTQILQPLKEGLIRFRLRSHKRIVKVNSLSAAKPYCFFPLQSEPEVSIQVLGRPYHKNQIELLRNLAASLPAGFKLVVKEHPRSLGLRPFSFYKQLFEIPNLYLVEPHASSMPIVNQAEFVAVISGTIGLEAIIAKKPVLILGHPKYEGIEGNMTQKCYNLFELADVIRILLANYRYDRKVVIRFLSALIEGSVCIDLYSSLLGKPGRYSFQNETVSVEDNTRTLARYVLKRINEVRGKNERV